MGQGEVGWGTPYILLKSTKWLMKIFPTSYSLLPIHDLENSPYFYIIILILLNHYYLFISFCFTRLSFIRCFLQCLEQVQAYVETCIKQICSRLFYHPEYLFNLFIATICEHTSGLLKLKTKLHIFILTIETRPCSNCFLKHGKWKQSQIKPCSKLSNDWDEENGDILMDILMSKFPHKRMLYC